MVVQSGLVAVYHGDREPEERWTLNGRKREQRVDLLGEGLPALPETVLQQGHL